MDNNYDTIVIGSGCGGAAAAALVKYLGHKTLLLEKNRCFGGRASTYEKGGFKFDHGHIIMRSEKGPHGEVLRIMKRPWLIPRFSHCGSWAMKTIIGDVPVEYLPNVFRAYLSPRFYRQHAKYGYTVKDMLQILHFALVARFMTEKGFAKINYQDLKTFLSKYTDNYYFHLLMGGLASVSFGATMEDASAGELIRVIQNGLKDYIYMGYPINGEGVSAIPNSFVKAASEMGCDIKLNTKVDNIVIENGCAKGVRINGDTITAKNVISGIGIKETVLKLVGKEHFSNAYSQKIENLKYSYGGISLKYALKKKITDLCWGGEIPDNLERMSDDMQSGRIPEKFPIMFVTPSNIDPSLAPEGTQVMSFISGGPATVPGDIDWTRWVEHMKTQAEGLFPGLKENVLYCDVSTPDDIAKFSGRTFGDAVGVSQTVDQVNDRRPSPVSPLKGLFYAGADVGRGCCATELASESAIALYQYFKKNTEIFQTR